MGAIRKPLILQRPAALQLEPWCVLVRD